jgi:hypothetical protein
MCFGRSFPVHYSVQARKTRVLNGLRKADVENGHSVLASLRNDKNGVPLDNALIA